MVGTEMRILLVEDDEGFLELSKVYLEKENPLFQLDTSTSAEKALVLLNEREYDAVVSDYQMPVMDGLEFLRIIREERGYDIPFIMFTGKGRKEVAIAALNLGANQYLQKGNDTTSQYDILTRMIVQEVEHNRTRKALRENEERLRGLFENMSSGVAVLKTVDKGDTFVLEDLNSAAEAIDGLSGEDIIGRDILEVLPGAGESSLLEVFRRVWRTGESEHHPSFIYNDEGIESWRENYVYKLQSGEIVAVYDDITDRKHAEEELRESERKYRLLADNATDVIWTMDMEGRFTFMSPSVMELLGYTPEELIGIPLEDTLTPESYRKSASILMEELAKDGEPGVSPKRSRTVELENIQKGGSVVAVETTNSFLRDENGSPTGIIGITRDITERKQAENRITHLIGVLRSVRNVNQLITKETDRERLIQRSCEMLTESRGYHNTWIVLFNEPGEYEFSASSGFDGGFKPMRELLEKNGLTRCGREAMERSGVLVTKNPLEECVDCPLHPSYEGRSAYTIPLKHMDRLYGLLSASIMADLADDSEERCLFEELADDIAFALYEIELKERRERAEMELRGSEEKYRTIFENTGTAVAILDEDTSIVMVNTMFEELSGYSRGEIEGRTKWTELVAEESLDSMREYHEHRRIDADNTPRNYEFRYIHKDGAIRDAFITVTMIPGTKRSIVSLIDITEKKRMERKLEESEENYRGLVENVKSIVMRLDTNGNIRFMNEYGKGFFGYAGEDIRGKTVFETIVPERDSEGVNRWGLVRDILKHPDDYATYQVENIKKNGERVWVSWTSASVLDQGRLSEVLFIGSDVTEQKEAEDWGKFLNSLLKHDVKNNEIVVQGNLELLKNTDLSEKQMDYLDQAMRSSMKGTEIIRKVEIFQKVKKERMEGFDLRSMMENLVDRYKAPSSKRGIEIEMACPKFECGVQGGSLLEELFSNLIDNSIKHSGGSKIRISGEEVDNEIRWTVEDNGGGIPKDIWDKIFNMGFKSGELGGTGIGLFIVSEIVKIYGGRIEVGESELGGARFDVYLRKAVID